MKLNKKKDPKKNKKFLKLKKKKFYKKVFNIQINITSLNKIQNKLIINYLLLNNYKAFQLKSLNS